MQDVDVVVVGAGSSGLAAAKVLRATGLTFNVFEAMGRTGSGQQHAEAAAGRGHLPCWRVSSDEVMRRNHLRWVALNAAPARSETNPS